MSQWDREFEERPGFFDTPKGPIIVVGSVLALGVVFLILKSAGSTDDPPPAATVAEDAADEKPKPISLPPAQPKQPVEAKKPAPEPILPAIAIPDETDVVEWTVEADPIAEDKQAPALSVSHVRAIKPGVAMRTFGADPSLQVAAIGGAGETVEVWNLTSHKRLSNCNLPGETAVAVAALSPQRIMVWGSESGLLTIDANSGKPDQRLPIPASRESGAHPECGLAVSPGGRFVALCRRGIRLYETAEFKFSGHIPAPDDQQVLSLCFHPAGERLLVLYETHDRLQYRLASYDLPSGQESTSSRPLRPGMLRHAALAGPMAARVNQQNRMYLFLGARAVVSEEDGRLFWLNLRPPDFAVPLDVGRLWIADGKDTELAEMNWGRMESLVRKFDFNREVSQINPEITANVRVEVGSLSGNSKAAVNGKLKNYLQGWLTAHGIKTEGTVDATLIVKYSERSGGSFTSLRVGGPGGEQTKNVAGKLIEPEVEVLWHHDDLDMMLWQRKLRISVKDVVCTPAQAAGDPTAGFAAAVLDHTLQELSELGIPYFVVKSLVGTKNDELPLVVHRLK